jgi:hypothetical protein
MQRGELPIRDPNQHRSALVVDTFHHRGETIRLVNEGLSDPVKCSSDELIAAVSTLLTIEVRTKLCYPRWNLKLKLIRLHRVTPTI